MPPPRSPRGPSTSTQPVVSAASSRARSPSARRGSGRSRARSGGRGPRSAAAATTRAPAAAAPTSWGPTQPLSSAARRLGAPDLAVEAVRGQSVPSTSAPATASSTWWGTSQQSAPDAQLARPAVAPPRRSARAPARSLARAEPERIQRRPSAWRGRRAEARARLAGDEQRPSAPSSASWATPRPRRGRRRSCRRRSRGGLRGARRPPWREHVADRF